MKAETTARLIVIGAGPNALAAAWRLARAGLRPLVLERSRQVGGVAATREFHSGFRVSAPLPGTGVLVPPLQRVLERSAPGGVEWLGLPARLVVLSEAGCVVVSSGADAGLQGNDLSPADMASYRHLTERLQRLQPFFLNWLTTEPPGSRVSASATLRVLWQAARLRFSGRQLLRELLQWISMPVADWAADWFQSERLRVALAATGVWAAGIGPMAPGTTARLLLQAASGGAPLPPARLPRGGLGEFTRALADGAQRAGADIRLETPVEKILVEQGQVRGVVADGREIPARVVVSGLDPKTTFLQLTGPQYLPTEFLEQLRNYRSDGSAARVLLALDGLPKLPALSDGVAPAALAGRVVVCDSVEQIERASDDWKYGKLSDRPLVEFGIPTLVDPSLAPAGRHVLAAWVQYVPTHRPELKQAILGKVLEQLETYLPGLRDRVQGWEVLTPSDIEQEWGLSGGHLLQGELTLDQIWFQRPFYGWAGYATPIAGLFLCGSATHPGLGGMGASGLNAARAVLRHRSARA
jgi:phytoene dehydrogenase-like protein